MFEKTDTTGMVVARLSVLSGKNDKFVGRTPASGQLLNATSAWQAPILLPNNLLQRGFEYSQGGIGVWLQALVLGI
jgi:hypothetical protein